MVGGLQGFWLGWFKCALIWPDYCQTFFRGVFLPVEITWIQAGLSCTGIFVKKIIFALTEVHCKRIVRKTKDSVS